MFRQIRSHSLPLQLFLPVLAFLPYLIFIFAVDIPEPATHNAQGWFYHGWLEGISSKPWLFMMLGWAVNLFIAYSLYWLNIQFEVIGKRTVFISMVYSLLIFTPIGYHNFHPGMLGGVFILISLIFIFLVYHSHQTQAYIFNSGLFWGLAVITYPPFLLLLPVYILSARYVKSTRLKDFLLLFTGLLSPVWVWLAVMYLKGELHFQWLSILQWAEIRKTWPPELPGRPVLWYSFFGFLTIVLLSDLNLYRVKKDVGRRVLTILGQLIWICPIIFLLFERVSIEILWVAFVPVAFLFSVAAFNSRTPWKSDLVFVAFILFLLAFQLNLLI